MRITKASDNYVNIAIELEGLKLVPYYCSAGVPTIGIGSTLYEDGSRVRITDPAITRERAIALFKNTLGFYESNVDSFTRDDININQFDSLVDFAYNKGIQALKGSTLLKKVNADPNDPSIRGEFMKWIYGGDGSHNKIDDDGDGLIDEAGEKKRINGLINRATAQANLYFKKVS